MGFDLMLYLVKSLDIRVVIFISIFSIIIVLLVSFLLISQIIRINKEKNINLLMKNGFNNFSTLIFDLKFRKITCLNIKKKEKIKEISLDTFTNNLSEKDSKEFLFFLDTLFENAYNSDSKESTFLGNIKQKGGKKETQLLYLFHATHIFKKEKIIYFNVYELKYLGNNKKQKNVLINKSKKLTYEIQDIKLLFNQDYFIRGNAYLIHVYDIDGGINTKINKTILDYMVLDCIHKAFRFIPSIIYFSIEEDGHSSIIISDSKQLTSFQLMRLVDFLEQRIEEMFEINSLEKNYDFRIVASKYNELSNNFDEAIKTLFDIERFIEDDKKKTLVYKKQSSEIQTIDSSYRSEIDRILKGRALEISFRPIVHITSKRVMTYGFLYYLSLNNSNFSSFDDFKKTAEKFQRKKDAFSLEARKVISTFISYKETTNVKLAYPINLEDVSYINQIFSHISRINEANLILSFQNNEFIDIEDNDINLRFINNLSTKGYECGLIIKPDDYTLKENIYNLFDVFFFDLSDIKNLKQNSREFFKIHSLLEKFVKYKKPLITINVSSKTAIELLVKSGITYFSSDALSPKSPMLLPLDQKIIKKLLNMYKK